MRFGTWCPAPKTVSNLATKNMEIAEFTNHLVFYSPSVTGLRPRSTKVAHLFVGGLGNVKRGL